MGAAAKAYKNWPHYDDDLVNKIYVDTLTGEDSELAKEIAENSSNISTINGEIININNNKLDAEDFNTFIAEDYDPLVETVDKKIETWSQENDPADTWLTSVEKESHLGDIWYESTTQKTYVYKKDSTVGPVLYYWQWQNVPVELLTTVGNKSTIYSGIIPSDYSAGDFWIIPLDCYSNSSELISSNTGYSEGMEIEIGNWILTVVSINTDTTINEYSLNIPDTSDYDITEELGDSDTFVIQITSTASFSLPTDTYGGSLCVAIADGETYASTDWIMRNNYTPSDKIESTYSSKVYVDSKILETQEEISTQINQLNNMIDLEVATINTTIVENKVSSDTAIEDLSDYTHSNVNTLVESDETLNTYISEVLNTSLAQIQILQDSIINKIQSSGGNNLLKNSVGFKKTTFWTAYSSGVMQQFIQNIGEEITISFKYKKIGTSLALITLNRDATNFDTILSTEDEVDDWTSVVYTYKSIINSPFIYFNSIFEGVQDNDAETNGVSGSKLVFDNGLSITDLCINYGDKQPWSCYFDEVYGKSHKLDSNGLELLDLASLNKATLDSNSLEFVDSNDNINSVFSKEETISDNIYANNSFNIGNLQIARIDDDNILEY